MFLLIGTAFIIAAYLTLKRNVAAAKLADKLFLFGVILIAAGVVISLVQLYLKVAGKPG